MAPCPGAVIPIRILAPAFPPMGSVAAPGPPALPHPKGMLWVGGENEAPLHGSAPPPYPLADEQAVGVLDGGSLVQQQGLELAFFDVIEGVEHHGQEL